MKLRKYHVVVCAKDAAFRQPSASSPKLLLHDTFLLKASVRWCSMFCGGVVLYSLLLRRTPNGRSVAGR